MKLSRISFLFKLLILQYLSVQCLSTQDFDFFTFIQQWPGSYCDSKHGCCYPIAGKPAANFTIYGLRPSYKNGTFPSNCDAQSVFDKSKILDLIEDLGINWPSLRCPRLNNIKIWSHEWMKHGTCSESNLTQHDYFQTALKLKEKMNLLQMLKDKGFEPSDNKFYDIGNPLGIIEDATGFLPGMECNRDAAGNDQVLKVYMCVDKSLSNFIQCPNLVDNCRGRVQFPKF